MNYEKIKYLLEAAFEAGLHYSDADCIRLARGDYSLSYYASSAERRSDYADRTLGFISTSQNGYSAAVEVAEILLNEILNPL